MANRFEFTPNNKDSQQERPDSGLSLINTQERLKTTFDYLKVSLEGLNEEGENDLKAVYTALNKIIAIQESITGIVDKKFPTIDLNPDYALSYGHFSSTTEFYSSIKTHVINNYNHLSQDEGTAILSTIELERPFFKSIVNGIESGSISSVGELKLQLKANRPETVENLEADTPKLFLEKHGIQLDFEKYKTNNDYSIDTLNDVFAQLDAVLGYTPLATRGLANHQASPEIRAQNLQSVITTLDYWEKNAEAFHIFRELAENNGYTVQYSLGSTDLPVIGLRETQQKIPGGMRILKSAHLRIGYPPHIQKQEIDNWIAYWSKNS